MNIKLRTLFYYRKQTIIIKQYVPINPLRIINLLSILSVNEKEMVSLFSTKLVSNPLKMIYPRSVSLMSIFDVHVH